MRKVAMKVMSRAYFEPGLRTAAEATPDLQPSQRPVAPLEAVLLAIEKAREEQALRERFYRLFVEPAAGDQR